MAKANLKIEGMHCGGCAASIEMYLSNTPGVGSAKIDYESRTAAVEYDDAKTRPEDLAKLISEIGYPAAVA